MAAISKHGKVLLRWKGLYDEVVATEDGTVLRNSGSGWKILSRVPKGTDMSDWVARKRQILAQTEREYPAWTALRDALAQFRLGVRFSIYSASEDIALGKSSPEEAAEDLRNWPGINISPAQLLQIAELYEKMREERRR